MAWAVEVLYSLSSSDNIGLLFCLQGADPHIEDETGKTVFDIANDKNLTKIIELLENYKK